MPRADILSGMQKKKLQGENGFHQYYGSVFGDKWLEIVKELQTESLPIIRVQKKYVDQVRELWTSKGLSWKSLPWYEFAVEWPAEVAYGEELPGNGEGMFYVMNASSLLPVLALGVEPSDVVLDACAAPGGKALFLNEFLKSGELLANDTSPRRRTRMQQLFDEFACPATVIGGKAETLFRSYPDHFDKILVDTPCSSEKHVLGSPKHLAAWSYNRVKQLKQRQIAILSGAFLALKPGGRMVYSTCALTPEENEDVVARLLKKKKDTIRLREWVINGPGESGMERGAFDANLVHRVPPGENLDPMFVAVFERLK